MDLPVDSGKIILVVGLTFLVIVVFNVLLFFSAINKNTSGQVNSLRRAASRIRNPWEPEDQQLKKLSELVAELKKDPNLEHKANDETEQNHHT